MYFIVREEGAEIMASINAFTGVGHVAGVAGMSRTLRFATTAHPVIPAHAAAAAGNTPQRKRRAAAAATARSVDWGPI
ncbi:hypothetical protein AAHH97_19510 [Mycolicibacterium elephantis]|uniref:hypothetical protein n=1 Tax=Mycolicibacterium elephantis TaxID=81858 RepID=UPI000629AF2D|nr:hypothetical protein [Mycolicibacterium elephantis]KKW65773.1 hypothetical protein AAV95_05300 [Mycolicibacterium elephantis]OBA86447.1 hypothetical protein A5633_00875 [Mycolicibacterium elephantis]